MNNSYKKAEPNLSGVANGVAAIPVSVADNHASQTAFSKDFIGTLEQGKREFAARPDARAFIQYIQASQIIATDIHSAYETPVIGVKPDLAQIVEITRGQVSSPRGSKPSHDLTPH